MAANKVSVATPGPAGVPGLTYEGVWTEGDVYQVRDCVRYTDGNLYVVNVQHTAATSNNPLLNSTYWSLFINANDAFHQTASSENGQGAYLAMQKALRIAKIKPEQIDYINAHGTATPNNDLSESVAIKRVLTIVRIVLVVLVVWVVHFPTFPKHK